LFKETAYGFAARKKKQEIKKMKCWLHAHMPRAANVG
jgi:hypothetical protein